MMLKPEWWEYPLFDDDGFLSGIRDDVPPKIKTQYEEYLEEEKKRREKGIKL